MFILLCIKTTGSFWHGTQVDRKLAIPCLTNMDTEPLTPKSNNNVQRIGELSISVKVACSSELQNVKLAFDTTRM